MIFPRHNIMSVMQNMGFYGSSPTETETNMSKTFVEALKDKYVDQEEFDDRSILPKDKSLSTEITFIGFGKISKVQKQLTNLISIDLSKKNIGSAGNLTELSCSLNRVQLLDLSDNSLSWNEIVSITCFLPALRELIITNNNLCNHEICERKELPHKKLNVLTVGRTFTNWTSIIEILSRIWLQVEQLDLWDCNLNNDSMKLPSLQDSDSFVKNIHTLKLSQNLFTDLIWINRIGITESLIELDLSRCQLKSIQIDDNLAKQLGNLKILNISYNNLDEWRSIANLFPLKNLTNLICHENPIYISERFAKAYTVGLLGSIKYLNRAEVTSDMRRDCEILYLRKFFLEYQSFAKAQNNNFKHLHPRYEDLAHFYGLPEDLTAKQKVEKYITVDLCLGSRRITKKLPCDMRVGNVRMLCKRLFNLKPSSNIQITCVGADSSKNISYQLDKDGQTLHFFSVNSGQKLLIEELIS